MGDRVSVIDGLEGICDQVLSSHIPDRWSEQTSGIARNLRTMKGNQVMEDIGLAIARAFGLSLHSVFFQECSKGYEIQEHSHINSLPGYEDVIYALLYTSNEGQSTLTLKDPDSEIEREKGRLVLVPENRTHAVKSSDGHNTFVRFVLVPRIPGDRRKVDKTLLKEIQQAGVPYYL